MKKIIPALALAGAFFMATPVLAATYPAVGIVESCTPTHYFYCLECTELHTQYTIEYCDFSGENEWYTYSLDGDWIPGDVFAVERDDNNTPDDVTDDFDIDGSFRYVGNIERR